MQDFENSVGFITGGAGGIGYGVAAALGRRGMHLVLADIEVDTLEASAEVLRSKGMQVSTEVLDVSDANAYAHVAQRVLATHGKLNFLFNNAGIATNTLSGESSLSDWRWTLDVNVLGVVHGIENYLGPMRESGEPGYIINTASLAGHLGNVGMGAYCASKFAVVGYSEVLRLELEDSAIDVSVLCPAWVRTRIAQSRRNHPSNADRPLQEMELEVDRIIAEEGISVESLAERVLEGMASRTFYLFSHADFWPMVEERLQRIHADYSEVL